MEDDNLSEIRPLDKVAARREQNRLRKQRERDRKREHQQLVVFDQPPSPSVVTCHAVTPAPTPSIPSIGVTPHRSSASLTVLACGLAIIGLGINGWFAWNRGTTDIDKCLMAGLGFLAEGTM